MDRCNMRLIFCIIAVLFAMSLQGCSKEAETAFLPPASMTTTMDPNATAMPESNATNATGSDAAMTIHALASTTTTAAPRSCTVADEAAMWKAGSGNADGTFPKILSDCGRSAYSWLSFHPDRMTRCTKDKLGITESCARCFTPPAQHAVDHCKTQCMFNSWCSHSCLSCTASTDAATNSCAGTDVPAPSEC